jgi:hypothetical protein
MTNSTAPEIDRLADSLMQWAGSATLIIDHMSRSAPPDSTPQSTGAVLSGLVRQTLESLERRHTAADVATAATVLADAVDSLCEEIYIVDLGPPHPRPIDGG